MHSVLVLNNNTWHVLQVFITLVPQWLRRPIEKRRIRRRKMIENMTWGIYKDEANIGIRCIFLRYDKLFDLAVSQWLCRPIEKRENRKYDLGHL